MPYKKSYRKKPAKKARYARPYRKAGPKKASLVKTIKRVIHSQIENKIINKPGVNIALRYASLVDTPVALILHPTPAQGVGQAQRIGNQIRVMKGYVNGRVNLLPYNLASNNVVAPVVIKMWLCKRKATNTQLTGLPDQADYNEFFQSGNGTVGFQGNPLDLIFDVNKDVWTVFATKQVTLNNANFSNGATGPIAADNNSCTYPFRFDFTKHLGLCKYNDNVPNQDPTNKELFLVFQTIPCDGQTASGTEGQRMAEIHYNIVHEYEDA